MTRSKHIRDILFVIIEGRQKQPRKLYGHFFLYHHSQTTNQNTQWSICHCTSNSWYKYLLDVTIGSTAYNANKFLAFNFFKGLKPVFERLKSDYLLTDCQGDLNQIQNESLKGFLWCQQLCKYSDNRSFKD